MVKSIRVEIINDNFTLIINDGEEKKYNLRNSFEIFKANLYFKNLTSSISVKFISFKQYFELIKNIAKDINVPFEVRMG